MNLKKIIVNYDKIEKIESDPIKYYTQPHELDAQVYGFKRLSKLRNKPFEQVVRNCSRVVRVVYITAFLALFGSFSYSGVNSLCRVLLSSPPKKYGLFVRHS